MPKAQQEPVDPRDVAALVARFDSMTNISKQWMRERRDVFDDLRGQAAAYAADEGARGKFFDVMTKAFARELFAFAWAAKNARHRNPDVSDPTLPARTPRVAVLKARDGLITVEIKHAMPIALVYLYARLGFAASARSAVPYSVTEFATWLAALATNNAFRFGRFSTVTILHSNVYYSL